MANSWSWLTALNSGGEVNSLTSRVHRYQMRDLDRVSLVVGGCPTFAHSRRSAANLWTPTSQARASNMFFPNSIEDLVVYNYSYPPSPTACPTGNQVYRFIDTAIRNTKTRFAGKPAASLSVIRAIWARVIKLLKFRHEDFLKHYNSHHVTRIEVHLQHLVEQGKLIRGTWFKKQWISFMTLFKITEGWFSYALANGTHSWDITLLKVLSVVLQSALSSRSGDMARSQLYEGCECLCWKDVTLKLDVSSDRSNPSVQDLRGTFLLRFTKGAKRTLNDDKPIFCDPLDNLSQSTACAIKLLLAFALRLGRVFGSTVEECLRHAAQRADGTVQWTSPDAAVFPQMKGISSFLVLDKPAGQEQVRFSLQQMAQVVGILEPRIDTRALRRGALRDQACVKKVIAGVATRATAMIASHSNKSYAKGITRDYVGALEETAYNSRAENQRIDRFAPAFAQEAPSAKVLQERFTSHEIDAFMKAHDMDTKDQNARKRAGVRMKKERAEAWRTAAKDQPEPTASSTVGQKDIAKVVTPLRQHSAAEMNVRPSKNTKEPSLRQPRQEETQEYSSEQPLPSLSAVGTSSSRPTTTPLQQTLSTITDEFDNSLLDPQLLEHDRFEAELKNAALQSLVDSVFLTSGANPNDEESYSCPEVSDQIDGVDSRMLADHTSEECLQMTASSTCLEPIQGVELSQITTLSGNDFVQFFARINIFHKQAFFDRNNQQKVREYIPSGNSRDPPATYLYYCKKGCGFSNWSRPDVNTHEVNCSGVSMGRTFKCQRKGCNKSYKNEVTLKTHVANEHDWKPVACEQCPDQPDVLYPTKNDLYNHRNHNHNGIEEQFCPLQDQCHSESKFTQKKMLKQHLTRRHKLTTDQLKQYVPDGRKGHSNIKGKKRKPKGWHLGPGDDEQEEEDGEENEN